MGQNADADCAGNDLFPAPWQSRPCVLSSLGVMRSIQPRGSAYYVSLFLITQLLGEVVERRYPALGQQLEVASSGAPVEEMLSSPGAANSCRGFLQEVCPSEENSVLR